MPARVPRPPASGAPKISDRAAARGRTVIDDRPSVFCLQKLGNVGRANLHFQRGRYAVERLHPLALDLLPVLMQIDKAGRNHERRRVDDSLGCQWLR
jgi:hypothetical protein